MPNQNNLKPIRSVKEASEKGKKGGIKSGEIRRQRKALKEEFLCLLEEGDTQEKISLALIREALKGNVKAFEIIRDTIGEKPTDKQKIEIANNIPNVIIFESDCYDPDKIIEELKNGQGKILKFCAQEQEDEIGKHIDEVIGD